MPVNDLEPRHLSFQRPDISLLYIPPCDLREITSALPCAALNVPFLSLLHPNSKECSSVALTCLLN